MDHAEPKTRKEMKGRDKAKSRGPDPYSQKRVRQLEALMEKRQATRPAGK